MNERNPWSTDAIEKWPLAKLRGYKGNARIHDRGSIEAIKKSIIEFGFVTPLLIDEQGEIIAGHGRAQSAAELGIIRVPVIVARGWSEDRIRGFRLADNATAERSAWDFQLLKVEIGDLGKMNFPIEVLGFPDIQLAEFVAGFGEHHTDPEEAPEPPVAPVTRFGDLWRLGQHRLLCGDATSATDVAQVLAGTVPVLMVTDPPYGIEYDAGWRKERIIRIEDDRAVARVTNDDRSDWTAAFVNFPGNVIYCWSPAGSNSVEFYHCIERAGFAIRMQIIWAKSHFPIGRGDYHVKHEPCWYAVRQGATGNWQGDRKQNTLWEIDKPQKSETGHSTQKPVECMRRPMENNSRAGDAVYDPFVGSGTTIIAAQMTGRICHAIEIDPAYVDMAVERWQAFTGGHATLEATGHTMAQVRAARIAIESVAGTLRGPSGVTPAGA
jgi:DNA modification methylase